MKRRISIVIVLAAAAAVAALLLFRRPATEADLLRISGTIEITDVQASFKVGGRVAERAVSEGEGVEAGQILARLDDAELAHEVAIRRAELAAAGAVLAELEAGTRPEEIDRARAELARAQAEAVRARSEHERQEGLYAREVISARELEVAQTADRVARAQVAAAETQLALLVRGPRREQIDLARERYGQAREALALAETRLAYATLASPLAGLVLAEHVEAGEQIAAGTPIVTIGDLSRVWLRGYVDEPDLGRVRVGQSVRVTTDLDPQRVFAGTLSFIAAEAE
ncbi:MAG TPA: efflux RND transporter periplasmic adaptor subunit, partial [Thermoanaerobaculia bacterium]|nr:efflux RND transporter periplasmic adaptor subunit [Thermoanaerobaculia bacterium]